MNICPIDKCTACMACKNICPKKCISMEYDLYGREQMKINEDYCINCRKCIDACPANNSPLFNDNLKVYAAVYANELERETSSSGGLAYAFAKSFILRGGVVYSSCFDKNQSVKMQRFNSLNNLFRIKGSKYVISYMDDTLLQVKKDLKKGNQVLIIGTPCQVSSIRKNVEKGEKLFCIDLICHGVPSQQYLKEYIRGLTAEKIVELSFRKKSNFIFEIKTINHVIKKNMNDCLYLKGFIKNLFFRESCYQCQYAQRNRIGDVTLGDFWGLGKCKNPSINALDGISLVMINSLKGEDLFKQIIPEIIYEERSLDEAIKRNLQLCIPSVKHRNYEKFLYLFKKYGFNYAAIRCLWFDILKSNIREKMKINRR